jgi:hypothetical protein
VRPAQHHATRNRPGWVRDLDRPISADRSCNSVTDLGWLAGSKFCFDAGRDDLDSQIFMFNQAAMPIAMPRSAGHGHRQAFPFGGWFGDDGFESGDDGFERFDDDGFDVVRDGVFGWGDGWGFGRSAGGDGERDRPRHRHREEARHATSEQREDGSRTGHAVRSHDNS